MNALFVEKTIIEEIDNLLPFIFVNGNNIDNTSIFNILLSKNKEIYSYDFDCRINKNEDILCVKIKYNILSFQSFYLFYLIFNIMN